MNIFLLFPFFLIFLFPFFLLLLLKSIENYTNVEGELQVCVALSVRRRRRRL